MDIHDASPSGTPATKADRRYLGVAEEILRAVAVGNLGVGDRLPDERALAQRCGVSRSTVREALLALELGGIIEVRPGAGCFLLGVGAHHAPALTLRVDSLPGQMLEVRQLLEPAAARLCAASIRAGDLAGLSRLLDDAERESERSSSESLDRLVALNLAFHRDLSRACGNEVLAETVGQLVDAAKHPLWALVDSIDVRNAESRRMQVAEHRAVLAAVAGGRQQEAAEHMAAHLGAISNRIFGSGIVRSKVARTRRRPPP
jgi:DNA-binding FadR family transcriptional regulator